MSDCERFLREVNTPPFEGKIVMGCKEHGVTGCPLTTVLNFESTLERLSGAETERDRYKAALEKIASVYCEGNNVDEHEECELLMSQIAKATLNQAPKGKEV